MCFSLAVAMLLLYYSFAIVGMELFARYQLKNCCKFVLLHVLPAVTYKNIIIIVTYRYHYLILTGCISRH